MAKAPGKNEPLVPSLLDRLTDDGEGRPYQSLAELRKSVRRDLENLLNTRWRYTESQEVAAGLGQSLVQYGLPDFSGGNMQAASNPDVVYAAVEQAIERFEPRLSNVRVRSVQTDPSVDRTLRFHIEAVLQVEPWQERVRFNTVLEPVTGKVTVKAADKT